MHRALPGSRQLTVLGAFRHGVYLLDPSTCIRTTVEHYLLDRALPTADRTCTRA
jgi:hypothetical protein